MGYYTDYDISNNREEVADAIEEASGYSWYSRSMNGKWYDWHDHCTAVSKRFPDELITVEGDGEEQGDHWKAYFKNGKSQKCEAIITFEPFDESKLK